MRRFFVAISVGTLLLAALISPFVLTRVNAAPAEQGTNGITSPQSFMTVQGNVVIEGTAAHPDFWKYELHYAQEPNPSNWVLINDVHEDQPVTSGRLEVWNSSIVPDGIYSLRLRVARRDGNYDEYYVRQITVANAGPAPTDTPEAETPTPTDIPTLSPAGSTPEATADPLLATPTIVIEQPQLGTATPTEAAEAGATPDPEEATPTVVASRDDEGDDEGKFSGESLTKAFMRGGQYVLMGFAGLGMLALVRTILVSGFRWIQRKSRHEDEFFD